jgi:hypothetical protein
MRELVGAILALDIIRNACRTNNATILIDNQAVIQSLQQRQPRPGQYLVEEFHSQLNSLLARNPCLTIHICWVPGHEGNNGNELADRQAKATALGDYAPPMRRIRLFEQPLPTSASALKATALQLTNKEWHRRWTASSRGRRFATAINKAPPRSRLHRYLLDLPRKQSSILIQLRSGHTGLNHFLHRIHTADSPLCPRCRCPEDVRHYLLHCRRYTAERHHLRLTLKGSLTLRRLLGDKKAQAALLAYIQRTERFPAYSDPE